MILYSGGLLSETYLRGFLNIPFILTATKFTRNAVTARSRGLIIEKILLQRLANDWRVAWPKLRTLELWRFDNEYRPELENSTLDVSYLPGPGNGQSKGLNLSPPELNLAALWLECLELKIVPSFVKKLFYWS